VRDAFEAHGIGWAYWSYNETFTVMSSDRQPFGPAERQAPDRTLLETLLGQ
jgi:endoglucanase